MAGPAITLDGLPVVHRDGLLVQRPAEGRTGRMPIRTSSGTGRPRHARAV